MSETEKPAELPPPAPPAAPARSPFISRVPLLLALGVLLAAALAAAFWLDARTRLDATQQELARRLRDIEKNADEARSSARQAQEALRDAQMHFAQIETRLAESQNQQVALEALYQELSSNRDEMQLAEIEQVLAIASHQLQLAGNVRAALLALQLAEGRLARADRPQFLPIRRAIARDIERLKTVPALDVVALSTRIDNIIGQVETLPLAYEQRTEPTPQAANQAAAEQRGFWSRLGAEIWGELRQLVVVRELGNPEPPLLPPSQAYFVRENLRLRLLNARLMLLLRDEAAFRRDLRLAEEWLRRFFEPNADRTVKALAQIKELASSTLSFEVPAITDSLQAVREFKSRREREPR